MKYSITVIALFIISVPYNAFADEPVKQFFNKYIQLSDNFDLSVAELYSDSARIHGFRKYPQGTERSMELTGAQWKQLVTQIMPLAKAQNDKNIFSEVTISKFDNNFKIKANRYSNRKCYTDIGYYMIVEPIKGGNLQIIEEYSETQPQSSC